MSRRPAPQLPAELWDRVFRYLPPADKLNVRATCKFFGTVVDHRSQWRNWAVELRSGCGSYNQHFWQSLRRRRVSSAVMRSPKAKDWKQLARSLPSVSTLVMEPGSQENLHHVKHFPRLRRLAVRDTLGPVSVDSHTVSKPQQLTHLSLCRAVFPTPARGCVVSGLGCFANLSSLVCHHVGVRVEAAAAVLDALLGRLPKLKHLSLSMTRTLLPLHHAPFSDPRAGGGGHATLSSLELVDYSDDLFGEDTMRLVPHLRSLALYYLPQDRSDGRHPPRCHLRTWLGDLPHLSELLVTKGPPVRTYISSCPPTVTGLTLRVPGSSPQDMAATAAQLPDLRHLHFDPWPSHLGAHAARIPRLFPKLRSLKLRLDGVAENGVLALGELQELEHLQVLDSLPQFSQTIDKLRVITDFRLEVRTAPPRRDVMSCSCVTQGF